MMEYRQLKISADPHVAEAFKAACALAGVSMAGELSQFMKTQAGELERQGAKRGMGTREKRRKAVRRIIGELNTVLDGEEAYLGNIPDNLRSGCACEAASQAVELLGQAIELLQEAF
jgi:hypothetical protein